MELIAGRGQPFAAASCPPPYISWSLGLTVVVQQNLSVCPEDESIIMSSFVNTMTSLSVKQGEAA